MSEATFRVILSLMVAGGSTDYIMMRERRGVDRPVVLYIDDSRVEREIVQQLLEGEGFEVLTAEKPAEGIAIARKRTPHLVLLDLHLPEEDGCAVADHLREMVAMQKVPIVALSASLKEGEREEVIRKFDGYIQKPVDIDTFASALREFMKHGKEEGEGVGDVRMAETCSTLPPNAEVLEVLQTLEKVRSTMSHDLRTPLTVMISYASTVGREKVGELNERQKDMLDQVVKQGFQMDAMISELVSLARETLRRYGYPPNRG